MAGRINSYKELRVYQKAMDLAMEIFEMTKSFPQAEKYSLVDQIRRSFRGRCVPILPKPGESVVIKRHLLRN